MHAHGSVCSSTVVATEESDEDEEDEDEEMDANQQPGDEQTEKIDKKLSYIYYKPLNEHKSLKDWHFKLNS